MAGDIWPARAREIATAAAVARTEQSARAQLLADIKAAFSSKRTDRLSSEELTEYLTGLDDRPWAEWRGGKPLTKASLARLLTPFGISSGTIRLANDRTPKGYNVSAFDDAFTRFLPTENATTPQAHSRSDCGAFQNATPSTLVALSKPPQAHSRSDCGGVAFLAPLDAELAQEIEL